MPLITQMTLFICKRLLLLQGNRSGVKLYHFLVTVIVSDRETKKKKQNVAERTKKEMKMPPKIQYREASSNYSVKSMVLKHVKNDLLLVSLLLRWSLFVKKGRDWEREVLDAPGLLILLEAGRRRQSPPDGDVDDMDTEFLRWDFTSYFQLLLCSFSVSFFFTKRSINRGKEK